MGCFVGGEIILEEVRISEAPDSANHGEISEEKLGKIKTNRLAVTML